MNVDIPVLPAQSTGLNCTPQGAPRKTSQLEKKVTCKYLVSLENITSELKCCRFMSPHNTYSISDGSCTLQMVFNSNTKLYFSTQS